MRSLLTALLICACATGCSSGISAPQPEHPLERYSGVETEGPQRLAPLVLETLRSASWNPLLVEREAFQVERYEGDDGRPRYARVGAVDALPARRYTECRIRIASPEGGAFAFTWRNEVEPELLRNPGVAFTAIGGDLVREYAIPLTGQDAAGWRGDISAVGVVGPNQEFAIESISFTHVPPTGPNRVTLDHVTMEAIDAHPFVWRLTVPSEAVFEAHVALIEPPLPARQPDGATFRVTLSEPGGAPVTLVEKTLELSEVGRWQALRAPLSSYSGKSVELAFEVDSLSSPCGDYSVWGNPMVYGQSPRKHTPVVLISCDTMRSDHLSCYGYARETTPHLDAFAKESVLFENAITPETWTLTAHMSMLTGLYPTRHGVNASTNLAEAVQTLPEALAGAGYMTGGFTGYRIWMLPGRGLAHGFDVYSTPELVRDVFETKAQVESWLDTKKGQPVFLFFHNYDLHSKYGESQCKGCDLPYYPPNDSFLHFSKDIPEPETLRAPKRPRATELLFAAREERETISPEELEFMIAMYDDAIRGVDAAVAETFAKLKDLGIYDDALIVVTSDHGEHFGEHGEYLHEHLYEGSARVPLLIKFPHGEHAGKRVTDMVQLIDLMPTILDVAGLPVPLCDGRSLVPVIKGERAPAPWAFIRRLRYVAVRNMEWKYIRNIGTGERALYHIAVDPAETVDVLAEAPPILPLLETEVDRFFFEEGQGWHIAFLRPKRGSEVQLVARTAGSFETVRLLQGGAMSRNDLITWDDHGATVNFGLLSRDELLLRTAASDSPIALRISSSAPVLLVVGNEPPIEGDHFTLELDPASPPERPPLPAEVNQTTLVIWYQKEPITGTAAPAMTPEELEALRALGYGGDIQDLQAPATPRP